MDANENMVARLHFAPTTIFTSGALLTMWAAQWAVRSGASVSFVLTAEAIRFTSVLILAMGCVGVLIVQAMQRTFNRTSMLPGAVLIYTALSASEALKGSAFQLLWEANNTRATVFFAVLHYALPLLGLAVVAVAVWALIQHLPLSFHAFGAPRLYTVDANTVQRARGLRDMAKTVAAQPKAPVREDGPKYRYPALTPRTTFDQLYGNEDLKAQLMEAGNAWLNSGKNGVLLFGPPGTGKTAFAEAMAGQFNLGFIKVTFGDMASKWINQSTEQLVLAFNEAKAQQPVMLFIDEVDAVLKSRDGGGNYEEYERMVTTFLDKVVDVRGSKVLVAAATNYVDRLDDAAIREGRFDHKIQVPLPDNAARRGLISQQLAKQGCTADDETMERLSRRWGGFNVPRLMDAAEGACALAREEAGAHFAGQRTQVTYAHFYRALRKLQGRKGGAPEGAKALDSLYLDPEPRERLANLATQLVDVDAVERMGGTIPKGVVFFGPPGTGKTATAMALARECGWSFISRTGRELMMDGAIDKLGKEASDLRPAIVFIDEADDILGDRRGSPYKSATNELLILIDGAEGMLQDVVWIAATNSPDSMDSAALRGGRFGQKIAFGAPSAATAIRLIEDWAARKVQAKGLEIEGDAHAWAVSVHPHMAGLTPADMFQVLDAANNEAITSALRGGTTRTVTAAHVDRAVAELRGG